MPISSIEELRAYCENLDLLSAEELEQLDQEAAELEAAMATAGGEFEEQIEEGEQGVMGATEEYNGLVASAQASNQSAAAAKDQAAAADATDEIAAIVHIDIAPIDPPDVGGGSPEEVQAAFGSLVAQLNALNAETAGQVNERIDLIKAALAKLNNPEATEKLKEAVGHLIEMATSVMTAALPPPVDTDAEIAVNHGQVDSLRQ